MAFIHQISFCLAYPNQISSQPVNLKIVHTKKKVKMSTLSELQDCMLMIFIPYFDLFIISIRALLQEPNLFYENPEKLLKIAYMGYFQSML